MRLAHYWTPRWGYRTPQAAIGDRLEYKKSHFRVRFFFVLLHNSKKCSNFAALY